ncbi:MAG: helix-turn-helix domain-containing protein [Porticoccaceae bacterium]
MNKNLLTPQKTAEELGVTTGTLAVWRSTGRYKLPFVKVGRKVMYRVEDIQSFVQSRIQTVA